MLKVMLVDDKIAIVKGLKCLINWDALGYEVIAQLTSAKEAVKFAENNEIDLIVTDIKMPDMDGIEMIEEIAKFKTGIKYILLSAYGEFEYAKRAIDSWVSGYILKPVNESELSELLGRVKSEIEKERKYEDFISRQIEPDTSQNSHLGIVGEVIEYVQNNYSDCELNLNYLAQILHVTPSYLGRVFKNKQGESFSSYLLNLRINNAKRLLKTTEEPVYEIANRVGFSDANYFCMKFQMIVGMSATRYRKQ